MPFGLLQAALREECRELLPLPGGVHVMWLGFAGVLLAAFVAGCVCGIGLLARGGIVAWRWWQVRYQAARAGASNLTPGQRHAGYRSN